MKFINLLICSMMLASSFVACNINDAYDLGNIKDDGIGLGTDETQVSAPIIQYNISYAELEQNAITPESDYVDLQQYVNIASIILPSSSQGVDISLLTATDNQEHVDNLVNALIDEMETNEQKRLDFCEVILNVNEFDSSGSSLIQDLDLESTNKPTAQELSKELEIALSNNPSQLNESIQVIKDDLAKFSRENLSQSTVFTYSSALAGISEVIDLDQEVRNIFNDSLGINGNEISIFFESSTDKLFDMDVNMNLSGKPFVYDSEKDRYVYKISSEKEFEYLLNNFNFNLNAKLETIYPSINQTSFDDMKLNLKFTMNKEGAFQL